MAFGAFDPQPIGQRGGHEADEDFTTRLGRAADHLPIRHKILTRRLGHRSLRYCTSLPARWSSFEIMSSRAEWMSSLA